MATTTTTTTTANESRGSRVAMLYQHVTWLVNKKYTSLLKTRMTRSDVLPLISVDSELLYIFGIVPVNNEF